MEGGVWETPSPPASELPSWGEEEWSSGCSSAPATISLFAFHPWAEPCTQALFLV